MAKTKHIGVRLPPIERDALEQAAGEDARPLASLVRKVLAEWLREKGYLPR